MGEAGSKRATILAHLERGGLVAVVGPTASGKTELACELAEAVAGEVISIDSVQIYRRFDIGSGKPTPAEIARARHHLVSIRDADEAIDAAELSKLARDAIADVTARGKRPILCGGTFLWMKAAIFGLAEAPPANEAIRARHKKIAEDLGRPELHRRLAQVDPASAARLHPNDLVRVSRALEVFEQGGRPMSALQEEHRFQSSTYDALFVGRETTAEELTARIRRRVDTWLLAGWIDEVRALTRDGYADTRAMSSVGYREVSAYTKGDLSRDALAEAIVQSTRVFARRQRTWLRSVDVTWL
jgi:tRNA dimethylallyltransferase